MNQINKAILFALEKHKGQYRKFSDLPYIAHPIRVANNVNTETQKIVALLHDVLEDTDATPGEIEVLFSSDVVHKVVQLTHESNQSYYDYITHIEDEDCIAVKVADIMDNLMDHPSDRMIEKGTKALYRLINK